MKIRNTEILFSLNTEIIVIHQNKPIVSIFTFTELLLISN